AFDQQCADPLGAGRPARLAGGEHGNSGALERGGQQLHLRALAGPLAAFQRDEPAAAQERAPAIRWRSPTKARPTGPSRATALAATSGTSIGGMSGALITSLPSTWPAAIGAGTGPSNTALALSVSRAPRGSVTT